MELIIVLIICVIALISIYFIFGINLKEIKNLAKNKELNNITNRFPENKEICEDILKILNNEDVQIKENTDKKDKTSLYIVISNTILIANIKDEFTRIQTIAHECLHSIQSKKLLWFNFIFTNIFNLYFIIAVVLTLFGVFHNYNLQVTILLIMGIIFYVVRSYLEIDAMIKAEYLAEKYINSTKISTKEEIEKVINKYSEINKIGIPTYIFMLLLKPISRIIIYTIIVIIYSSIN